MMDLVVFVQSVDWVGLLSQVVTTGNATPPRKHRSTVITEETQPATRGVREHKYNHHHLKVNEFASEINTNASKLEAAEDNTKHLKVTMEALSNMLHSRSSVFSSSARS